MRIVPVAILCSVAFHFPAPDRLLAQTPDIQLRTVLQNSPTRPVFVTNAHDGTDRLFLAELAGRIQVLQPGATSSTVFLDIATKVLTGNERGFLGIAFHPDFSSNRRFFVNYTRRPDGATVVAEYRASASNPNVAEAAEIPILVTPHPTDAHNGGMIEFGPDGFLYIAIGDGGPGKDPQNRAQDKNSRLGKILRIDVDKPAGASVPYSFPASNPFLGTADGLDEIYAYGFRNPWRFSFDRLTGELYVADVGQDAVEEVDIVQAGGNYGWRVLEGWQCTGLGPASCGEKDFIAPIATYVHDGRRCSITGGYVYRGSEGTFPIGAYIYADYCTGEIFMLFNGTEAVIADTTLRITSFGEDERGELYVMGDVIRKLVNSAAVAVPFTHFEINDDGALSLTTLNASDQATIAHAYIQRDDTAPAPKALAIIGSRQHGVLASEAAISAGRLIQNGRIFVDNAGNARTGLALANPHRTRKVRVDFNFTDPGGRDVASGTMDLPSGGQVVAFLDETPFSGPSNFEGSLTFTASSPISGVALRGITNARDEFLIAPLPVAELADANSETAIIPQFVDGGSWSTELLLVNLTHEPIRGALRFLDSAGIASGSEVSYSLPADGSQRLKTSSASEVSRVGSLQVNPAPGDASPSVAALFSFDSAGVTVSQMGIPGTPADRAFRLYTEISGEPGAVDSLRTGVAIANPSRTDQLVSFELFQLNGTPLSVAGKAAIPADGQTALFVDQIPGLEGMPKPFRGVLRVSSASPIAVTGLRGHYNERREFLLAAIVPAGESTDDSGELFLPHLVDGGGYSTQLVLFNRTSDPVSGNIFFFNQAGQPINLLPPFIP